MTTHQPLRELVQQWETEAQRLQDIAALGESPTEAAETNAKADAYWRCAHQLAQALEAEDAPSLILPDPTAATAYNDDLTRETECQIS